LNILPLKVATDLKEKGNTVPQMFDNVTVMFSDFCRFTELSSQLQPQQLIDELNDLFTSFDNIIESNHCERIKTIGDAYLAVCGLPEEDPAHAINIINAGIQIIHYLEERNRDHPIHWKVRIGVHSGPAIAGVVGAKKYSYDVFGDTINTASRMESYSDMMKINVSKSTYIHTKDHFRFTERGAIDTKGKGKIDMYYVEEK
jgi:adenylate cyclase